MRKFLRKPKFIKIFSFLLVLVFVVNVAGCGQTDNGVSKEVVNKRVGIGRNTPGYTVYSQSTFDRMTKEIFMGYLLSGREFDLLVLPTTNEYEENKEMVYEFDTNNKLFTAIQNGVYKYSESTASYINPDRKLLLYYATDRELLSWFNAFEADDNFLSNTMDFVSSKVDVEKPSRFRCRNIVNMGTGIDDKHFCGSWSDTNKTLTDGLISGGTAHDNIFKKTDENGNDVGGMILLFGYSSIEGYLTYDHINNYKDSAVANSLTNECDPFISDCYDYTKIKPFEYSEWLLNDKKELNAFGKAIADKESKEVADGFKYGYTEEQIKDFANGTCSLGKEECEKLEQDVIEAYTEKEIMMANPGYDKLKRTYELLGGALLAEHNYTNITSLATYLGSKEQTDGIKAQLDIAKMLIYDFEDAAKDEAFDIKLSISLYSRHGSLTHYPNADTLVTGYHFSKRIVDKDGNATTGTSYDVAKRLREGFDDSSTSVDNTYLLLVTADGFIIDRGDDSDQQMYGFEDFVNGGMNSLLAELVRMDGCPNGTIAAEMFNMLTNLKIFAGAAFAVTGATAVIVGAVGLKVAAVIGKLAAANLCAPVPGGRIAALVCAIIAGVIAIGVGAYLLISGIADKAKVKGMGASDENYCQTYASTFNVLFETISLTIPVYHYKIPVNDESSDGLSMKVCTDIAYPVLYEGKCYKATEEDLSKGIEPTVVPMYYYANLDQALELNLDGCPMLMYFKEGKMVDYIYGASTPQFILEILRLWGLLAMREMIYQASYDESNTSDNPNKKVNIYHTKSNSARTHTIKSAKYCFTLGEYQKDLYNAASGYKCYDLNGNPAIPSEKDLNDIVYIENNQSKIFDITYNQDNLHTMLSGAIKSKYNIYFSEEANAQFRSFKSKIEAKKVTEENVNVSIEGSKIQFKDSSNNNVGDPKDYVLYTDSESNSYFVVSESDVSTVYYAGTATPTLVTKVATFKGSNDSIKDFSVVKNKKENYTTVDFLRYLHGMLEFSNSTEDKIPIYFTVTVKESPQANYYIKSNGEKKTCDDGEYLYYRDNKAWFDNDAKCLADNKVKAKDNPYSTEDVNPGNDYRYHSTSLLIGTIIVKLEENGQTTVTIDWE